MPARCTVLIDLPPTQRFHLATLEALGHAAAALGADLHVDVVGTDDPAAASTIDRAAGVVIGPGSPYRDPAAAEAAIATCRARGVPLVAT